MWDFLYRGGGDYVFGTKFTRMWSEKALARRGFIKASHILVGRRQLRDRQLMVLEIDASHDDFTQIKAEIVDCGLKGWIRIWDLYNDNGKPVGARFVNMKPWLTGKSKYEVWAQYDKSQGEEWACRGCGSKDPDVIEGIKRCIKMGLTWWKEDIYCKTCLDGFERARAKKENTPRPPDRRPGSGSPSPKRRRI